MEFGTPAQAPTIIESQFEKDNRRGSIIRNQIKANIADGVAGDMSADGYVVDRGIYVGRDGQEIDTEKPGAFNDSNLVYDLRLRNISGSEVLARIGMLEGMNLHNQDGRAISDIVREAMERNGVWRDDSDYRTIIERIDSDNYAVVSRLPKYSSNKSERQYDNYAISVGIGNSTFRSRETVDQLLGAIVNRIAREQEVVQDYDEMQNNYQDVIDEYKY